MNNTSAGNGNTRRITYNTPASVTGNGGQAKARNPLETFTVELNAKQAKLVQEIAAHLRATPGQLLVALAMGMLNSDKGNCPVETAGFYSMDINRYAVAGECPATVFED